MCVYKISKAKVIILNKHMPKKSEGIFLSAIIIASIKFSYQVILLHKITVRRKQYWC